MEKELILLWGKDGMICVLMMMVGYFYKIIKYISNSYCFFFFYLISFYIEVIKNLIVDFLIV